MTTTSTTGAKYSGVFGWVRRLKDWVEGLADKPYAVWALFLMAVAESIFFPIPVDILLIALCVSVPRRSLWFALICTLGSVIGGVIGYGVGYGLWYEPDGTFSGIAQFFFNHIPGFTTELFAQVEARFQEYALETVFTAGFTPIPYKLITITAGVFNLNLAMFMFASLTGRAARFFLVAALFYFFGAPVKAFIDKYLEVLTVLFVILLIGGFVVIKYLL